MPKGPARKSGTVSYHALRALTKDNPTEVFEFLLGVMRGTVRRSSKRKTSMTGIEIDEETGPTIDQSMEAATILAAYQYGRPAETHNVNLESDHLTPQANFKLLTTADLEALHAIASKAEAIDAPFQALPDPDKA